MSMQHSRGALGRASRCGPPAIDGVRRRRVQHERRALAHAGAANEGAAFGDEAQPTRRVGMDHVTRVRRRRLPARPRATPMANNCVPERAAGRRERETGGETRRRAAARPLHLADGRGGQQSSARASDVQHLHGPRHRRWLSRRRRNREDARSGSSDDAVVDERKDLETWPVR